VKSLLTGRVTPEKRTQISAWLDGILNPSRMTPSPTRQTTQVPPFWGLTPLGKNATADLALGQMNDQYPEAAAKSPTATVLPLWPWIRARRFEGGHMQFGRGTVPSDADAPETWSRKYQELLDTSRHELSHGMGLPDNYDGWSGLSAQDVSDVSARLHEDIALPPDRPTPPPLKGSR
jgi:hypothetical protein